MNNSDSVPSDPYMSHRKAVGIHIIIIHTRKIANVQFCKCNILTHKKVFSEKNCMCGVTNIIFTTPSRVRHQLYLLIASFRFGVFFFFIIGPFY